MKSQNNQPPGAGLRQTRPGSVSMGENKLLSLILMALVVLAFTAYSSAQDASLPVHDDPLVRMPGTQPLQVTLESSSACQACHGGGPGLQDQATADARGRTDYEEYNIFKAWQGSMMGNSARDPLMFACLTVAAQDAIYALGHPQRRRHLPALPFPEGLAGGPLRPAQRLGHDGRGLRRHPVHVLPPAERPVLPGHRLPGARRRRLAGLLGRAEQPGRAGEFRSQTERGDPLADTRRASIKLFSGDAVLWGLDPFSRAYDENGGGQYFVSPDTRRRGPFADVLRRRNHAHTTLYSRYHKGKFICGTCHDVSNPSWPT